jgi:phosphatidylglycerol lysyltransferase
VSDPWSTVWLPEAPARPWTLKRLLKPVITVAMFVVMIGGLRRLIGTFDQDAIVAAYERTPWTAMLAACGLLIAQHGFFAVRELFAVEFAGRRDLSRGRVVLASLVSRSLSTLGIATITGFALRFRLYSSWGLSRDDVTRLTLYNESMYYIGLAASCAAVFLLVEIPPLVAVGVTIPAPKLIGAVAAAIVLAYVIASARREQPLRIRTFALPVVSGRELAAQVALPLVDLVVSAALVWMLLPAEAGLGFGETAAACFLGGIVGSISQVPGGLGVFETVVLQFVPPAAHPQVLAALLIRRVIVTLVPVAVGTVVLVGYEVIRRGPVPEHSWPRETVATAMAVTAFAAGVLLMVAASLRLHGPLAGLGPIAHAIVFAIGFATLIVARGLHLRRARSWWLAMALFSTRALLAVVAGPDVPALVMSLGLVGLLIASKRAFHRHPGERDDDHSWCTAFVIAIAGVTWVAIVADPSEVTRAAAVRAAGVVTALAIAGTVVIDHARRNRREAQRSEPEQTKSE